MHVEFRIEGSYRVPDGTKPVAGAQNLFRLPSGQIVSVHPIIEMATRAHSDDHRNLSYSETEAIGVLLDLYERTCELIPGEGTIAGTFVAKPCEESGTRPSVS